MIIKKRLYLIALCFMMLFAFSTCVQAKPSKAKVKKAYEAYLAANAEKEGLWRSPYYIDINRDRVNEMIVQHAYSSHRYYHVFTYKKGRVIEAGTVFGDIYYNLKEKKICSIYEFYSQDITVYKLKGIKLKTLVTYTHRYGSYTSDREYLKNDNPITGEMYNRQLNKYSKWKRL